MWPPSSEDSLLACSTVAIAFQRMSERTRCSRSASPGKGASRSTGIVLTYGVLSATSIGTPEGRAWSRPRWSSSCARSGPSWRTTASRASSHSWVSWTSTSGLSMRFDATPRDGWPPFRPPSCPPLRLTADTSALRESRDLRLLVLGNFVSGLGTQTALVALPYQVYVQTRSPALTGLLGAAELGPLIALALVGGALADRLDRRRLLLADQGAPGLVPATLCAAAVAGSPPIGLLYVLAGLMPAFGAVQNVTRSAIIPNVVAPEHMRSALAINFGPYQLTMVLGPGLG